MHTFLPYPSFAESARALDAVRLRKQRLEAFQILSCLQDPITLAYRTERGLQPPKTGWANHPAVRMWRGYEKALRLYYNYMIDERRSGTLEMLMIDYEINGLLPPQDFVELPPWFGDERLHSSHRSRLHFKGTIDVLVSRIKSQSYVKSAKAWLKAHDLPEMNVLKRSQRDEANDILDIIGVPPAGTPNWYDQWAWAEAETFKPYLWPENADSTTLYVGTKYDD